MQQLAEELRLNNPFVTATRSCGLIAGIDIAHADGSPFHQDERAGERACIAMRKHGLLTRPVTHDTIVAMPPLCIRENELRALFNAMDAGIRDALSAMRDQS